MKLPIEVGPKRFAFLDMLFVNTHDWVRERLIGYYWNSFLAEIIWLKMEMDPAKASSVEIYVWEIDAFLDRVYIHSQ